ncbi:GNAT family N-acetyltransferase [Xanthomonas axonopodis pv. begoniae]|uniref:GNAT family N-acetyltransferase n=1 Tax=Xanthomonas phaseoli TaxID=1985254 RepID=UPI000CEE04F8|nr:GNAT family N-acetyltransferase [Xanthomonas phaseoli]MBO9738553.1 GNAT family N-acetyltransferase [Xanthomonas axonopodis pv. begoniae]MBO9771564.1 GNAT family N-acetyltransferase [Xanthomonas axonopodis pv. begoniae]MCC8471345.1 GNAT family N-acetyltransferase [Xanthomonas phaseoli]PPT36635.1 GNAT family N-acetyltransferase [Xanthomonas axonopodis pv. begoniae]
MAAASFPNRNERFAAPPALHARGIGLRAARDADLPWLRDLYASTREAELAAVPWPEVTKRLFLDQQFALQHAHYLAHFADADFLIVETAQAPLGRLYLQRATAPHVLVDISLLPTWRGRGLGTALVAHAQASAAAMECALSLHVLHANPAAQRLYARLGFSAGQSTQTHLQMRWNPHAQLLS